MVSLGEGLMPKAGETPEPGANPLPRFGDGNPTGPMAVFHLFDSPLTATKPYESYMGCLTIPRRVTEAAERSAVLLDYRTKRAKILECVQLAYPGVRPDNVHVWTLRGKSRVARLGKLWEEWKALGVHLVEDGWKAPSGLEVFTDSGTYAPTFLVGSWKDAAGATHVFLCDGYAASAEAMQAASLSEVLDVDSTMAIFSPTFELPCDAEGRLMQLDRHAPDFAARLGEALGVRELEAGRVRSYAAAIEDAEMSNMPLGKRVLRADDFLPEKAWKSSARSTRLPRGMLDISASSMAAA